MKAIIYPLLFSFFIVASHTTVYGQPREFENKIVAVVNEDVITQADLDIALGSIVAQYKQIYSAEELTNKIEEARQDILNQMIEDRLILQEAKRRGVVVEDEEVEERVDDVKSRFPSDDDFEGAVTESGISFDTLRNRYKEQIMMSKLVNHEVREKIVATPSEISDYYTKHADELKAPESVHLKNIVIRFGEGNSEALVKQKVDDISRLIKEGRDFSELAKLYSQGPHAQDGGDAGFVEKGQMRKEFEDAVFNLKAGEVSEPIKTETGYYIFKVEEKKEGYTRSQSELHDTIENLIFQDKAKKRYKEWMDKLKRDAFIQIK